MASPSRTALLTKTHKVLKQHYKFTLPESNRPLLEELLYACCLENATHEAAEKTYTKVVESFFDWNEVRVSTVSELAEVMQGLPNPQQAAANLKRVLQSVFEATYSFDLEALKKEKLGQAATNLEKFEGVRPFAIAYVTQVSLGGHAIPLDRGSLDVLQLLGIANEDEAKSGVVSGIERAIPKNKGVEFASLLHQLGAEFTANPYSNSVRNLLLAIEPEVKDRLPKKPAKKGEHAAEAAAEAEVSPAEKEPAEPKKRSKAEAPPAERSATKSQSAAASPKKKPDSKQLSKRKPR